MNFLHRVRFWLAVKRGDVLNKEAPVYIHTPKIVLKEKPAKVEKQGKMTISTVSRVSRVYMAVLSVMTELEELVEAETDAGKRNIMDEEYKLFEDIERTLTRHGAKQKSP